MVWNGPEVSFGVLALYHKPEVHIDFRIFSGKTKAYELVSATV